jgi:hypothetical protein
MKSRAGRRIAGKIATAVAIVVGFAWTAEAATQPSVYTRTVNASGVDRCWTNSAAGNFKVGSKFLSVGWAGNGGVDECFGVAPSGTIWHTWRGASNRWYEMPGHGHADNMNKVLVARNIFSGNDVRVVCVWAVGQNYCNGNEKGVWSGWSRQ